MIKRRERQLGDETRDIETIHLCEYDANIVEGGVETKEVPEI